MMSGMRSSVIRRIPKTEPTPGQIQHYEILVPYFQTLLASTAQRNPNVWVFHDTRDTLKLARVKPPLDRGRGSSRHTDDSDSDLIIPKSLTGWKDLQSIGWHHRNGGSVKDPHEEVTQEILYVFQTNMHKLEGLFEAIEEEEEEEQEDPRDYYDYDGDRCSYDHNDDDWPDPDDDERDAFKDYTACDKECGYCGRCPY